MDTPKTEAEFDAALAADIERLSAEPETEQAPEPVETKAEPAAEAPPADKTPDQPEVVPAPVGWSDEDRAHFATLPLNVQKTIARRESEREKALGTKSQEFADSKRRLDELDAVLKPHRQAWELNGISEAQALGRLFAAQKLLSERPAEGIAFLARQYGVDLSRPTQQAPTPNGIDRAITQRLERLEGTLTQAERARISEQQGQIERTIQSWAAETDKTGQPLRPHFEAVRDHMTALLPTIRQQTPGISHTEMLNKAYDMAAFANPDVRQVLLDAQARSEQARKAAEARHKADKAKAASSSISGDGGTSTPKLMDIDEAVKAAMAQFS
jgi:hypothetical protein